MSVRALLFALGLLFVVAAPTAQASGVSSADVVEIRAVIQRQIEAFRRDDARGAFALVSPGVRETFRTPENFLDVVRLGYRAVYRPSAVAFRDVLVMGEEVVQPVQITDVAGSPWVAYYSMQRQQDGSWKTNGCHLVQPARTVSA
jgi:hypothetical protein